MPKKTPQIKTKKRNLTFPSDLSEKHYDRFFEYFQRDSWSTNEEEHNFIDKSLTLK